MLDIMYEVPSEDSVKEVVINEEVGEARTTPLQNYVITGGLLLVIALATLEMVPLIKGVAGLLVVMLMMKVVGGSELRRRFPFELWLIIGSALTRQLPRALLSKIFAAMILAVAIFVIARTMFG